MTEAPVPAPVQVDVAPELANWVAVTIRHSGVLPPLVPERSPGDVDCLSCDGAAPSGVILCDPCCGIGWLPTS